MLHRGLALSALAIACLVTLGSAENGPLPEAGEDGTSDQEAETVTKCTGPGESYGIPDFPCPTKTVQGWVTHRHGDRTRAHAWYLFAGLHRISDGDFLWRSWPTSTQAFPGQFDSGRHVGVERVDLVSLPGAYLERPVPGTPRLVGTERKEASEAKERPDRDLALPRGPVYTVPEYVRKHPNYRINHCIEHPDDPAKAHLIDGPTFQTNGDVMIAGVIYSPAAKQWIQVQELWSADHLDELLPEEATDVAHVSMPENSVVLKPMLWPVRGDGYTPLPLWDNPSPYADRFGFCEIYSGFERQGLWHRAVALTARVGPSGPTADARYLVSGDVQRTVLYEPTFCLPLESSNDPITYEDAPVVGLDRFYTLRFSEAELAAMHACDRALLDQSAIWSYGRPFDQRDALVLIAMHIMTKEQPGWTFQSAWWYDRAWVCSSSDKKCDQCKRFAKSRPDDVPGSDTWRNYLMTTTYGMTQKSTSQDGPETHCNRWPPRLASDDLWPVEYNPYIELAAGHPIETNCINCHHRAAWPSRVMKDRRFPERTSAYLVEGANAPGLQREFDLDDEIFQGLVTLDAMWAISDRAYYKTSQREAPAEEDEAQVTPGGPGE